MATTTHILLLLYFIFTTTTTTNAATNTTLIATILTTLGFQDLSSVAANLSTITTPATIFAPTDSSLRTCPSCSIPLLLQEHSVPGLYPLHFLRSLAFGTKIATFSSNHCLTITTTTTTATAYSAAKKVFINGVEIAKPDLFNNGILIIHSIQGYLSHLSPRSCFIESATTLAFPHHQPPQSPPQQLAAFFNMRLMLRDAMMGLRGNGYSIVALAIRVRYSDLSGLNSMTLFAIDDESLFSGGDGHAYVAELGFHIVPNRLLMAADLVALSSGTVLPTMDRGRRMVVTTAGDGGPLTPVRINYVKVKRFDLVYNNRIVVHGLSMPFRHVDDRIGDSRFGVSVQPPLGGDVSSRSGVSPPSGSYASSTVGITDDEIPREF